jgi:Anti-sigma-K factor rskA, C-terminal
MSERLFDYLLGELAPEERAAFEADPARVADAERLRPIVTRLESLEREEWDPPEAPALVLPGAREPERAPRRRRRVLTLRPVVAAGLALLLLAIGVGSGRLLDEGGGNDRGRVLALDPVEPAGGSAHGTATILGRAGGRARFVVRGLKPSASGGFYELWLMNSADDLVSLGSFRVPASGKAVVTVPLPADPDGFAALDISAEPADGNPAHSASSVLRAPLKPS